MSDTPVDLNHDIWSRWLLHVRHGDDPEAARVIKEEVEPYANRVLAGAQLAPGMTLADVGTGDGLIAFRAIERVGPELRVVLTDVSKAMLQHTQARAVELGVSQQCTFVECSAEKLTGIEDGSVDVVVTRAVLAYVADKAAAFREFRRILKRGGRVSFAEPVFQDDAIATQALKTLASSQRPADAQAALWPLLYRWKSAQFPDTPEKMLASPLTNYTERTLFESLRAAGFGQLHLEFHIDMYPSKLRSWQVFLDTSPHPMAPPLTQILAQQFSAGERKLFEESLRPLVESGRAPTVVRTVYLTGVKEI